MAQTLHAAYDEEASAHPHSVAIVGWTGSGQRFALTYAALVERSRVLARGLAVAFEQHAPQQRCLCIRLPRTHPDFGPACLAASRVAAPFVLCSTDLPDRKLETDRLALTLRAQRPQVCLVADAAEVPVVAEPAAALGVDCAVLAVGALEDLGGSGPAVGAAPEGGEHGEVLCFMFTGGTHRTKIVEATHAMVLHERVAYNELWRPRGHGAVVLAHTSAYWGASALGQMSIALAYSGTCVFTEVQEVTELRQCIVEEKVNILGVVPDHLDLLAPRAPATELPSVEVVFTWGERLPRRVSDRWRGHGSARVLELLIATEYWLSLWADPLGEGLLRSIRGTDILVLTEAGTDAQVGELGELCISGPMVMARYRSTDPGVPAPDPFYFAPCGRRYFRTSDLVRRVLGGFVYKGRADMMAKDKGKWVDMIAVEDTVCRLPGITAAKVMPDPVLEHFHIFVQLEASLTAPGPTLDAVRAALPAKAQLWHVPELPRHPVTRKVDANRLQRMLRKPVVSWPLEPGEPDPMLKERLAQKAGRQVAWTLGTVGMLWIASSREDLYAQLALAAAAAAGSPIVMGGRRATQAELPVALVSSWLVAACTLSWPITADRLLRFGATSLQFTYGWLTLTYIDDAREHRSRFARLVMALVDEMPFWKVGAFLSLAGLQRAPGALGVASRLVMHSAVAAGAGLALRRGRLIAWPVVFWSLGAGMQIERDCNKWWRLGAWQGAFMSQSQRVVDNLLYYSGAKFLADKAFGYPDDAPYANADPKAGGSARAGAGRNGVGLNGSPSAIVADGAEETMTCSVCGATGPRPRWPAKDETGKLLVCNPCSLEAVAVYEARATAALSELVPASRGGGGGAKVPALAAVEAEPAAKRAKVDGEGQPQNGREHGVVAEVRPPAFERPMMAAAEDISQDQERRLYEWWWYRHKTDSIDFSPEELRRSAAICAPPASQAAARAADDPAGSAPDSPEAALVCAIIGEIEPLLKPVGMTTVLVGLDSLRIARLSNAFRARLGRSLTAPQLRQAQTVGDLVRLVEEATPLAAGGAKAAPTREEGDREFAVWYSPGQYSPMGAWVLRAESPLDVAALAEATRRLVDRHPALRVYCADPLRYMSLVFDAASLFTVYAPIMDAGPRPAHLLRRLMSWCLANAWPRVRTTSREAMYAKEFPDFGAPLTVLRIDGGQNAFEDALKHRRCNLEPPGGVTAYELRNHIVDVWDFAVGYSGRFAIMRAPPGRAGGDGEHGGLFYVDLQSNEIGELIPPSAPGWQRPPYGFPALYSVTLTSGSVIWLRLERADELRVVYRFHSSKRSKLHHCVAFRAAPERPRETHDPVVVSMVSIGMYHSWGDGNCYLPLVQDFFTYYDVALGRTAFEPPPLENAFEELERRLMDTFYCRASPMRPSLRGTLWRFHGRGFGHTIGLEPAAMAALVRACGCYRVPLDVTLLGLVVCAMARADDAEDLEFTLYVPMRDGVSDAMGVGLYADWRDLAVSVDKELGTTLGTVLQLSHKIQQRQWTVFNALRKPERAVVNIQPLDFERRSGYLTMGENMWHGGDQIGREDRRESDMGWMHQPANFVIEQQDEDTWWILASVAHDHRQAPWMRAFVFAVQEALAAFLFEPLTPVHRRLPSDAELLSIHAAEADKAGFL